jgi:hypothetical protein
METREWLHLEMAPLSQMWLIQRFLCWKSLIKISSSDDFYNGIIKVFPSVSFDLTLTLVVYSLASFNIWCEHHKLPNQWLHLWIQLHSYSSKCDPKLFGANLVLTKSHLEKSLTIVDNWGYYFDIHIENW